MSEFGLWLVCTLFVMRTLFAQKRRRLLVGMALSFALVLTLPVSSAIACSQRVADDDNDEAPVFLARATGIHSYVDPALGFVLTEFTAVTVECLSGACAANTTVVVVGGEVGDLVTRVAGEQRPAPNNAELIVIRAGKSGRAHPFDARFLSADQRRQLVRSHHRGKIAAYYLRGIIK